MTDDPKEIPGSPEPNDETPGVLPDSERIPEPDRAEEAALDEGAIKPAGSGESTTEAAIAAAGPTSAAAARKKGATSSIRNPQPHTAATGEPTDELPWVDDPVSKWWVGIIVAVFGLIIVGGFLLGSGGLLTPGRAPRPVPTAAPSPSAGASAAASASPAASVVPSADASVEPSVKASASVVPSVEASVSASGIPSVAPSLVPIVPVASGNPATSAP